MRFLITGATGFLGSRSAALLSERGHDVVALARPGGADRALSAGLDAVRMDAGDPAARDLIAGCDVVLHFAGVPDPARAREDPARAVRENAGTTLNLLEGCHAHGAGLVYPSSIRAALERPPDAYALSKRLGELACTLHSARSTAVRLTSVFGPGQVAWEGATGAIARFAARALDGESIVIPGDPTRTRDFVYVDDAVSALEAIADRGLWNETFTLASGVSTSLIRAAELVAKATGSSRPIEMPGGELEPAENDSYSAVDAGPRLAFDVRPLDEGISRYVDWLSRHPAAQGRARA
ncbi:MAG: NAD-dependent epimerase/dehydratase family protein [Actinomycetota bacterium]|nr:NAD-dependent epimerase/dehydratase family protein [Actinomycetota bacterium]